MKEKIVKNSFTSLWANSIPINTNKRLKISKVTGFQHDSTMEKEEDIYKLSKVTPISSCPDI